MKIDPSIRTGIIAVLSRVDEPRTLTDIKWHLPHIPMTEIAYNLDAMYMIGEIEQDTSPAGMIRYKLLIEPKEGGSRRGFDPAKVVRTLLCFLSAAAVIGFIMLIMRALP